MKRKKADEGDAIIGRAPNVKFIVTNIKKHKTEENIEKNSSSYAFFDLTVFYWQDENSVINMKRVVSTTLDTKSNQYIGLRISDTNLKAAVLVFFSNIQKLLQ